MYSHLVKKDNSTTFMRFDFHIHLRHTATSTRAEAVKYEITVICHFMDL